MFSEQEIQERFVDFFECAQNFCDTYNVDQEIPATIDPDLLYLVVVATYDDIARYKHYHLEDPLHQRSNSIKRAAFATKWIMQFSPLIFPKKEHEIEAVRRQNYNSLANAMFAIHFTLANLEYETGNAFNLNQEKAYELMYDLFYRQITGDGLILIYQIIEDAARGISILD